MTVSNSNGDMGVTDAVVSPVTTQRNKSVVDCVFPEHVLAVETAEGETETD